VTEAEASALNRIEKVTGRSVAEAWPDWSRDCARPGEALHRLERWLGQLSSPGLLLDHWIAVPVLARLAVAVLGASHHIADVVAQNPETGAILTDPAELHAPLTLDRLMVEADRLLSSTVSYAHKLDRLRFLKQRETLRLAALDLGRLIDEQTVWRGISDLADAVVTALRTEVWSQYASGREVGPTPPFSIVAFGKMGGQELNYSSDIDLVFVLDEGLDESQTKHAYRACELYRAALADKMGRGDLYRVDLRLRPFGSQGPIASPMAVYESYYRKYAETWEQLALLRSRVIAGAPGIAEAWEDMRTRVVFNSVRSDMALEGLVAMRTRIEEIGSDNDLKRRAGGIRDVEFLVQTMQMVFGGASPACQVRPTVPAIGALCQAGYLEPGAAAALAEAYVFFRQTEHRCQIVGNLQTHEVPTEPAALAALAHAMFFPDAASFSRTLESHRVEVRRLYETLMPGGGPRVIEAKKNVSLRNWIDRLPEKDAVWASLAENRNSLEHALKIAEDAPELATMLATSSAVTEAVISGEILEDPVTLDLAGLRAEPPLPRAVRAATDAWLAAAARWCLGAGPGLGVALSRRDDAVLQELSKETGLDVVALGSAASQDTSVHSDVDLVLLCPDDVDWATAERSAQVLLAAVQAMHASGDPLEVDVRLRPEGRKGNLVTSYEGFRRYEEGPMELWERFALGRSRLVCGDHRALELVRQAAYGRYIGAEDFAVLAHMKRRIENERVSHRERTRHLKLGSGALDDIQWSVQLLLMANAAVALACPTARLTDRLDALVSAGALSGAEGDVLAETHRYLNDIRSWIALLGYPADVLPENPDRLDKLASLTGSTDGNEVIRRYTDLTTEVRSVFDRVVQVCCARPMG